MAAVHGKNGYLLLNAQNFSTFLKSTGVDISTEVVDVTTFGKNAKNYIPGLNDGTIPLEGVWGSTVSGHLKAIYDGNAAVAFEYGPAGSGGGSVKYSGNCIMTSLNISQDMGSEVTFNATLQITDGVTIGAFE